MKNRVILNKLTLKGLKKDYTVTFQGGLNFISGPTSTGKTSILEMIDYALGSEKHKDYIEIGASCSKVELELYIGDRLFRITRDFADTKAAAIVEQYNPDKKGYAFYSRCEIDSPSNESSLSAFLLEQIGLTDIVINNQQFSFRDLFQFSYLKQTTIDNEDIMHEKDNFRNNKRKSTFEIIFRIFDDQLQAYKNRLKEKEEEKKTLEIRFQGIEDFLKATENATELELSKNSIALTEAGVKLNSQLSALKREGGDVSDIAKTIRVKLFDLRARVAKLMTDEKEKREHIAKLRLLYNQYEMEIHTNQLALDGYFVLSKYAYAFCPNCLSPISVDEHPTKECSHCGNEKHSDNEELLVLRKELDATKRKSKELLKYIATEEATQARITHERATTERELFTTEQALTQATEDYINPHIEQIEMLNYQIGRNNQQLAELQAHIKMFEELERLSQIITDKKSAIDNLNKTIRELSKGMDTKDDIIRRLSTTFTQILKAFEFPKLSLSFIHEKNYLPYVRDRKYDNLGSSGGVSLITMAYYLAILIEGAGELYPHLNLLLIDSPRKNLGAQAEGEDAEDFKDERIFQNVIKWMIECGERLKDQIQLVVVNNGYPDFLPKDVIVAEFDSDGRNGLPKGLIDDAE